jgi:flagellin-specific chaperone FliS
MLNVQNATQTYRMNQINGASPLDLLIMAYDAALASAGQQDLDRFTRAMGVLRDALDFSYDADIALGFFRLYQYCADLARKGKYDEAAGIIRELRDNWVQVRAQYQAPQPAVAAKPSAVPVGYGASVGGLVLAG